jgi:hypothetical protein
MAKSSSEPCCLWEPVKSQTSESGKFVRSIGTETEDKYFSGSLRNYEQRGEVNSSPRTEITFEYSVSKDKLNEDIATGSRYAVNDKPVEVFLEDPFLPANDKQNLSSTRMTLKLKEISRQEFSLPENNIPKKVSNKVDNLTFPRKSLTVSDDLPVVHFGQDDSLQDTLSSEKQSLVGRTKSGQSSSTAEKQPQSLSSSLEMPSFCADDLAQNEESSLDNLQVKRQRGSASSRKNPEPRKLLKRTNSNVSDQCAEERDESDRQEYYEDEPKQRLFDDIDEVNITAVKISILRINIQIFVVSVCVIIVNYEL